MFLCIYTASPCTATALCCTGSAVPRCCCCTPSRLPTEYTSRVSTRYATRLKRAGKETAAIGTRTRENKGGVMRCREYRCKTFAEPPAFSTWCAVHMLSVPRTPMSVSTGEITVYLTEYLLPNYCTRRRTVCWRVVPVCLYHHVTCCIHLLVAVPPTPWTKQWLCHQGPLFQFKKHTEYGPTRLRISYEQRISLGRFLICKYRVRHSISHSGYLRLR